MSLEAHRQWKDHLPQGWHALFETLAAALHAADEQAVIEQAKQKFGELRVYLERMTPVTEALADEAMRQSRTTCEVCGSGDAVLTATPERYYQTLCQAHWGRACPAESPLLLHLRVAKDGTVKIIE